MQVMADTQEQLNALVSDVTECGDVCKNAAVRFVAVGAKRMHCNVSMPVATATRDSRE